MFRNVSQGPPDPVYILKQQVDADQSPEKVDLGVGVYRNEQGQYHELQAIKTAKQTLEEQQLGHDYEVTTGNEEFLKNASRILFGSNAEAIPSNRITSVQAISGTGSIHLAALFLNRCPSFQGRSVYIGTPAWGNYEPLFNLVGLPVIKYRHYDGDRGVVDLSAVLDAATKAPEGSIFVLQSCCHNPSGADLSPAQWRELAQAMSKKKLFPLFDTAYQGLGGSLEEDAYGLRLFAGRGFELMACQSFSKNFGLYGERCGVLHVVSETKDIASCVYDQLRCLIRWEFSSSPAYGARLVNIILRDEELAESWTKELASMRERLGGNRKALYAGLAEKRKTPGNWSTILSSTGLFCFLPLSPRQCEMLADKFHIYMLKNGRINVSGLNQSNLERVVSAIDAVTRVSSRL